MQPLIPGRAARNATRAVFFIAGFGTSTWAPLVPYARTRLTLDEADLGMLLLCLGIGSLVAMPMTGPLTGRFGCRKVLIVSSSIVCGALWLLATVTTVPGLAGALLLFGAALGMLDVAANIHAVLVEKAGGKPRMSGFHGLYSVGGFMGAGGVSLLLGAGLTTVASVGVSLGLIALLLMGFGRHLLCANGTEEIPEANETTALPGALDAVAPFEKMSVAEKASVKEKTPLFVCPKGLVLILGCLCFIMFLAEGAMLDWSALFLTTLREVQPASAGMGYATFAVAMTIGRLCGDRIILSIGSRNVVFLGGCTAATGFVLAVFVPSMNVTMAGFALIGIGASNIVPILISATSNQKTMPLRLAISSITTLGYSGILVGPALIGFIAHATSLGTAFLLLAGLVLVVALTAGKVVGKTTI